ncbi:MAG: DUF418 domain-containing protein [Myxococcaceae bacterium]|jgi:uncharacterized protein|nr:DUF418 domain-containing protein [Myxococcaceae bacterium]
MTDTRRVASIDVLRGVALLGILVMNIQSFAMPHAAYLNPRAWGSLEGAEGVAWALGRLLFDFKFITLFSTLFGASLVLAGEASSPRRRLSWLVAFGLLHGYLVWYGDILFTYGVVGLAVLPALRWSVRRQVVVGLGLVLVSSLLAFASFAFFDALPALLLDDVRAHYDVASAAAEAEAFRAGWLTQLLARAPITFGNHVSGTLLESGWRAAGCMLLGMAAVRARVFEGAVPAFPFVPATLGPGLLLSGAGLWLQWSSDFALRPWLLAQGLHELGALGVAAGVGLGVVTLARRFEGAPVTRAIANLGRVAFSAYLMHSVVGTFVFGGHGLGQFGSWSRVALLLAPFAFWGLQLVLAWWWTSRYAVGPLEALWRGLSRGTFSLGRARRAPAPEPPQG